MKITKGKIKKAAAQKISAAYVAFVEGDFDQYRKVITPFGKLKRGQKVITFVDGIFVEAKVTSIDRTSLAASMGDGLIVRVSNGEYSWRVDGDKYAFPI